MGWESARRAPWKGLPGGAHTVRPAPEREEPVVSMDDIETCKHYMLALTQMAAEDQRFRANFATFSKWKYVQRIKWIHAIEQQALDGLDTVGIHVVTRVVMNRLES